MCNIPFLINFETLRQFILVAIAYVRYFPLNFSSFFRVITLRNYFDEYGERSILKTTGFKNVDSD